MKSRGWLKFWLDRDQISLVDSQFLLWKINFLFFFEVPTEIDYSKQWNLLEGEVELLVFKSKSNRCISNILLNVDNTMLRPLMAETLKSDFKSNSESFKQLSLYFLENTPVNNFLFRLKSTISFKIMIVTNPSLFSAVNITGSSISKGIT